LVLVFVKLSGLILAAIVIGAAATYDIKLPVERKRLRRLAAAALAVASIGIVFYFAWFSRGWSVLTPATGLQWSQFAPSAALAIVASWGGGASLGDLVHFVFLHPARPLLKSATPIYFAMIPLAVATFWLMARRLRTEYDSYLRFAGLVGVTFAAVMVAMWLRGAEIDLDERHFRIPAQLLLVGIVHAFVSVPARPVRTLFALVATLGALYGVASFASHASTALHHPLSIRGFRHNVVSAPVLDFMHAADSDAKRDKTPPIILIPTPELGLEVGQARLIYTHVDFEKPERIRERVWHGRVPKVFVVLQRRMVSNGKAELTLRAFADIPASQWQMTPIDSEFVAFTARDY
jgi:xanthosine utilization system XapX-like protein